MLGFKYYSYTRAGIIQNSNLFVLMISGKKLPIGNFLPKSCQLATFVLEGRNMVLEPLSCIGIVSMMKYTQISDQVNIKLLISIFRFCTLPTCINDIFRFATKNGGFKIGLHATRR